jgi:hypothetical protein
VYDMYPWNSASPEGRPPGTPRARGDCPSPRSPLAPRERGDYPAESAARAVQFALDRRDNGGDAATVPAPGAGRQ